MSDKIFANMRALSDDNLIKFAQEIGLDIEKFKADFNSDEVKEEVAKDAEAGKAAGVRGTPSIFVNGRRYQGPRTLEGFAPFINDEINKADALVKAGTSIDKVYEARSTAP